MEKAFGEQGLAFLQHFLLISPKFSENLNCHINIVFNARGLKLGTFAIFDMLFPFLQICLSCKYLFCDQSESLRNIFISIVKFAENGLLEPWHSQPADLGITCLA